jgi:FkbM family methyltransferase
VIPSAVAPLEPPFGALAPTALQLAVLGLARGSFLKRGSFRPSATGLLSAIRSGPIDEQFRGAAFRLHLKGSPTEAAMLLNLGYNAAEFGLLETCLAGGGTFVDVGANIGLYSLSIAAFLGTRGRVIAIEPEPVAHERLLINVAANAVSNVSVYKTAVGDRTGEVSFIHDDSNLGHSRVGEGGLTVPILPLADLLNQAGVTRVDALKIDVEGFEDHVLFPFFETWPREALPRAVVIEHIDRERWERDCIDLMLSLGYVQRLKERSNTVLTL